MTSADLLSLPAVSRLLDLAIDEDLGRGDVTTWAVVPADQHLCADVVAREDLVVFGVAIAGEVFRRVDPSVSVSIIAGDGQKVAAGARILAIRGPGRAILAGERTALNFLQRLSGTATLARAFADSVSSTGARVCDTRKTTPGYRVLEKAAARAGGVSNHRFDLAGGILIKDNHIAAAGSIAAAIARCRASAPHSLRVEIEVDDESQLREALAAGCDMVLLDNMSPEQVTRLAAVARERGVFVEVSGGITLDTAPAYASAGADIISSGAITHSAPAVDIALDFAR